MASHNCPVESHTGWLAPLSSWGSLACLAYHCHSSQRSCHSPCCCMLHYFRSYSFVRCRLGAADLGTSLRKPCLKLWGTKRQKPSSNTGISQMPAVKGWKTSPMRRTLTCLCAPACSCNNAWTKYLSCTQNVLATTKRPTRQEKSRGNAQSLPAYMAVRVGTFPTLPQVWEVFRRFWKISANQQVKNESKSTSKTFKMSAKVADHLWKKSSIKTKPGPGSAWLLLHLCHDICNRHPHTPPSASRSRNACNLKIHVGSHMQSLPIFLLHISYII